MLLVVHAAKPELQPQHVVLAALAFLAALTATRHWRLWPWSIGFTFSVVMVWALSANLWQVEHGNAGLTDAFNDLMAQYFLAVLLGLSVGGFLRELLFRLIPDRPPK